MLIDKNVNYFLNVKNVSELAQYDSDFLPKRKGTFIAIVPVFVKKEISGMVLVGKGNVKRTWGTLSSLFVISKDIDDFELKVRKWSGKPKFKLPKVLRMINLEKKKYILVNKFSFKNAFRNFINKEV